MIKLTDYILTPQDILHLSKVGYTKVRNATKRDWRGVGILLALALALALLTSLAPDEIFFWCFIVFLFYWNVDSRLSISLALAGLILIPMMLALYRWNILFYGDVWAERVAVWVYFFLCIGVGKQIYELLIENRKRASK